MYQCTRNVHAAVRKMKIMMVKLVHSTLSNSTPMKVDEIGLCLSRRTTALGKISCEDWTSFLVGEIIIHAGSKCACLVETVKLCWNAIWIGKCPVARNRLIWLLLALWNNATSVCRLTLNSLTHCNESKSCYIPSLPIIKNHLPFSSWYLSTLRFSHHSDTFLIELFPVKTNAHWKSNVKLRLKITVNSHFQSPFSLPFDT